MDPEVNSFSKADVARILSEYQELTEAVESVVDDLAYIQTGYESVDLDSWCLSNDHIVEISWEKDRHGCFDYGHFKFPVEYIFKTREELKEITRLKQEELEAAKQKKAEEAAAAELKRQMAEYERLKAKFDPKNNNLEK